MKERLGNFQFYLLKLQSNLGGNNAFHIPERKAQFTGCLHLQHSLCKVSAQKNSNPHTQNNLTFSEEVTHGFLFMLCL